MIATVALNPAIDHFIVANAFKTGRLNRVKKTEESLGGKGINIAMMLGILGAEVLTTGFLGWSSGKFFQNQLNRSNVNNDFILIDNKTRNNYLVIDESNNTGTLLDDEGPNVSNEEINSFIDTYKKIVKRAHIVILAGSLPKGLNTEIYKTLTDIAHKERARVIVNTQEKFLLPSLKAAPYVIMPDTRGTDYILGKKIKGPRDLVRAAGQMLSHGARIAVLTVDNKNFIVLTPEHCWECISPKIEVKNILRSSDAMLAGMIYSIDKGQDLLKAIRWGAALSACMLTYRGDFIQSKEEVIKYLDKIVINEIFP